MRCKIAQRLWKKVVKEQDKVPFTGYADDYVRAFNEYSNHIEEHGCWRDEP